jgi:low affinity Fe/Cu permease
MKFIPEIRQAWKMASIWAAVALAALSMVQADVLPLLQPLVPQNWWPYISLAFAVLIVVCRVLLQPGLHVDQEDAPK